MVKIKTNFAESPNQQKDDLDFNHKERLKLAFKEPETLEILLNRIKIDPHIIQQQMLDWLQEAPLRALREYTENKPNKIGAILDVTARNGIEFNKIFNTLNELSKSDNEPEYTRQIAEQGKEVIEHWLELKAIKEGKIGPESKTELKRWLDGEATNAKTINQFINQDGQLKVNVIDQLKTDIKFKDQILQHNILITNKQQYVVINKGEDQTAIWKPPLPQFIKDNIIDDGKAIINDKRISLQKTINTATTTKRLNPLEAAMLIRERIAQRDWASIDNALTKNKWQYATLEYFATETAREITQSITEGSPERAGKKVLIQLGNLGADLNKTINNGELPNEIKNSINEAINECKNQAKNLWKTKTSTDTEKTNGLLKWANNKWPTIEERAAILPLTTNSGTLTAEGTKAATKLKLTTVIATSQQREAEMLARWNQTTNQQLTH